MVLHCTWDFKLPKQLTLAPFRPMAKQQQNHSSTHRVDWMKHSWIEVGTNGYERIWMWTPVCLVLQNPGWLEHIPRTSTMLLKGNLFPSMLWMKLYRIIFITVCVLGAYQQHQQQAYIPCADCLIRPEWPARPWKLWSVVGFYDLFKTVASFGHVKTVFVFASLICSSYCCYSNSFCMSRNHWFGKLFKFSAKILPVNWTFWYLMYQQMAMRSSLCLEVLRWINLS